MKHRRWRLRHRRLRASVICGAGRAGGLLACSLVACGLVAAAAKTSLGVGHFCAEHLTGDRLRPWAVSRGLRLQPINDRVLDGKCEEVISLGFVMTNVIVLGIHFG